MTNYKELANALDKYDEDDKQRDEIAAILRGLDAQPVAEVSVMGSYHGKPILGCVLSNDSMQVGDKLYAAPVAAQPHLEKNSWQHAVDNQLVSFGRTSQQFDSPHDAVRWLIEQEVLAAGNNAWNEGVDWQKALAAQPQQAKPEPLSEKQVFSLIEANTEWKPAAGVWRLNEVEFARAIEAAHGIKD
jgi:hypothetical protein